MSVSLEALSAKPITLPCVFAGINYVHIPPLSSHKKGGYSPRLEENIPLKRQKDGCYPASLSWLFCLGCKRSIWLLLAVWLGCALLLKGYALPLAW